MADRRGQRVDLRALLREEEEKHLPAPGEVSGPAQADPREVVLRVLRYGPGTLAAGNVSEPQLRVAADAIVDALAAAVRTPSGPAQADPRDLIFDRLQEVGVVAGLGRSATYALADELAALAAVRTPEGPLRDSVEIAAGKDCQLLHDLIYQYGEHKAAGAEFEMSVEDDRRLGELMRAFLASGGELDG